MSTAADNFLFGGGTTSAKFPEIGTTVTGVITRVLDPQQQTDYATGTPKTWENGDPMMQLPVEIATELRDAEIDDDEGLRMLYIKGALTAAVRDAVKKVGSKTLEIGGTITVTYARNGEPAKKGFNPPKQYDVSYTPPGVVASGQFLGTADPAPATAAPVAAPAAAPVAAAAPSAAAPAATDPVTVAKNLLAVGTPIATIAQVTGLSIDVVTALTQLPAAAAAS